MSKATDDQARAKTHALKRRELLGTGVRAGAAALIPLVETACTTQVESPPPAPVSALGANLDRILTAVADRLIPADELGPSAGKCGVVSYINRSLMEWNQADLALLRQGLTGLDEAAFQKHGAIFVSLTEEQQDLLLRDFEAGKLEPVANGASVFNRLHRLTLEGMFSDPYYGGNANFSGWDLIGYPGAVLASTPQMQKMRVRMPPLHTSGHGSEHDGH